MAEAVTTSPRDERSDLLWGAEALGAAINRSAKWVFQHQHSLPITKVDGTLCASRAELIEACTRGKKRGAR